MKALRPHVPFSKNRFGNSEFKCSTMKTKRVSLGVQQSSFEEKIVFPSQKMEEIKAMLKARPVYVIVFHIIRI